jgi:hypothetical protein
MIFRMQEHEIDRIVSHSSQYLRYGLALMLFPFVFPKLVPFAVPSWARFGLLLGFAIFGLGLYAFLFRRWRYDPGLRMLAVLLVVLLTPCYGFFEYKTLVSTFFPAPGKPAA